MTKREKRFCLLLFLVVSLPLANYVQGHFYVHRLPSLEHFDSEDIGEPDVFSILVAGPGLDKEESATGVRDLAIAREAIVHKLPGKHRLRMLHPSLPDYSTDKFKELLREAKKAERLVLYFTGHGGGFNFGASSLFNITGEELFEEIARSECPPTLLVVDCCWAGHFHDLAQQRVFTSPLTLITSTDAEHPAPFPVSFLAPKSFGAMFFSQLEQGERSAFESTNTWRSKLSSAYPPEIGLTGVRRVYCQESPSAEPQVLPNSAQSHSK